MHARCNQSAIFLASALLDKGTAAVVGTLVHEMAHVAIRCREGNPTHESRHWADQLVRLHLLLIPGDEDRVGALYARPKQTRIPPVNPGARNGFRRVTPEGSIGRAGMARWPSSVPEVEQAIAGLVPELPASARTWVMQ